MKALTPIEEVAVANVEARETEPGSVLHTWLKLLADHNRLRIFMLLRSGERCVCDIEAAVRLPQNLVSHHLRSLREAGAITSRRDGRWVYYAVDKTSLASIYPVLTSMFDPNTVSDDTQSCQ